ncbi:succinyl-CoA:(R)-benzylsuccinate CoA-transferase subunit BbsF [bacterium BMS3Bbin10]|nr:succinyl-CoA:(R)-benzylsuccinate CoA-transferase subunit BbsF [bacterium BMS3Bbin10]HDL16232.1 CoA transferase [Hyphomicrobiales bacterium]
MTGEQSEARNKGPLSGLRAIELGSTVAGPFCARLLADFGADVIKVEQGEGDAVRSMGRQCNGRSLYGASILRGKRAVSINLRTEEGRALVRRLCETADIVVENFRAGTLERWGLGYETLSAVNPGLVMVRISGYGQDGPYSDRGGYGVVCEAVSGLREITGDPDRPPPRIATSLTDYIAGLYGAFGAVMAVLERTRTGRGQVVDSALYEGSFSFMEPHIPAFQQLGEVARRAGSRLPGNVPNSLFETRDHRHIVLAAASDPVFARLAEAMGQPALAKDPRFVTALKRAGNEEACEAIIGKWTRSLDLAEVEAALREAKVPAAPIYTVEDIFADPHYRHRDMLVEVEDRVLGPVTVTGIVPKLSATPGAVGWAGRDIGEDTVEVLKTELELAEAEIETLARAGVVAGPGLAVGGEGS